MPELLDIFGQDHALAQLQRSLNDHRMPHALVFAGPQGVGRRTTAMALAKTLLCEHPAIIPRAQIKPAGRLAELPEVFPLRQACCHCDDCRMFDALSHPDFHLVYKELARYHSDSHVRDRVMQELGIDVIDSFLIQPAYRASARGRGKIFVVREADLMSDAAQNALLKTLEEPPPMVRIILLCERTQQMLPTTVSRCWVVQFDLLEEAFVASKLRQGGMDAVEAEFWAAFTAGSIGMARALSQAGMYPIKRDIIDRLAAMPPGGDAELGEYLAKTMEKLAEAAMKAAKQADGAELSKTLASRRSAGALLELIASAYTDAMHLRVGSSQRVVNADQAAAIDALAHKFNPLQFAEIIEQLSEFEQLLWRNVNPKIVWDNVVITAGSAAPLPL